MKETLKSIFATAVVAIAILALAPPTQAQVSPVELNLAGIGTIAGGTTQTCTNLIIDVPRYGNVALAFKFNMSGSTTSNIVYTFSKSIDRSNWSTVNPITVTVAANGTTDVVEVSNQAIGAVPYLKLETIQNTHASLVMTNKMVKFTPKREY
jgi:hypothetical protein